MRQTRRFALGFVAVIALCVGAGASQPAAESTHDDAPHDLRPRAPWRAPVGVRITDAHAADVIYVKFLDDADVRAHNGGLAHADLRIANLPIAQWRPVHDLPPARLDAMRTNAERSSGKRLADMTTEFFAFVADGRDAQAVLDALNALDAVEVALPVPKPPAPPLPPNFEPNQGYLLASPAGVDALHAWSDAGTRGAGVSIVDLEYVFDASHADLPSVGIIGNTPVDPGFGPDHGTAVLGQLASLNNGWGTTGIASDSDIYFAGTFANSVWNVGAAITNSVNALNPGDVILIEQQMGGPNGEFIPIEWFPSWHNAVVNAVANGFIVVMAAGNGGQNLDDPIFSQGNGGHWPFLPENDSGAIIVGAGAAPTEFGGTGTPRSRLSFSTYGSRVNLQGWGQRVWTTGYGGAYSAEGPQFEYTSSFSGTSSASPIVAAACALVQSVYKDANEGATLTSRQMRELLASTGAAQQSGSNPATQNIGPLPDIAAAIAALPVTMPCEGDTNGDNIINFADLSTVLTDFGRSGRNLLGDIDHDDDVDFADFNLVLTNYGVDCR
ncbi:MAG: S8 family serine peptidase [Phycisphaerales bacterium]